MRKFFLISSAAMSLFTVGCTSPRAECESLVDTVCERNFECTSDQQKSSDTFKGLYGTNVAECKTIQASNLQCAEMKNFNDLCHDGKTFDLGKASECEDEVKAQSCSDYNDSSKFPAACTQMCK